MIRKLRRIWDDVAFRREWRQGFCIHAPDLFDHDELYPWGGMFSCQFSKNVDPLYHVYHEAQLKQRMCSLQRHVQDWLADNKIVYKCPDGFVQRHWIVFARKNDAAIFMLMFGGEYVE